MQYFGWEIRKKDNLCDQGLDGLVGVGYEGGDWFQVCSHFEGPCDLGSQKLHVY